MQTLNFWHKFTSRNRNKHINSKEQTLLNAKHSSHSPHLILLFLNTNMNNIINRPTSNLIIIKTKQRDKRKETQRVNLHHLIENLLNLNFVGDLRKHGLVGFSQIFPVNLRCLGATYTIYSLSSLV